VKFKYLVIFILAAALAPACAPSQDQLQEAVGEYLKKNPEVMKKYVQEAVKGKGRQPPKPLAERIKEAIKVPLNNAPIKGKAEAPITIVEFSDFQCPFCNRVNPTLEKVLKEYNGQVRIAYRNNPLPFHKNAMSAAKASLAAKEQGKFWEMHDLLFEGQRNLTDANIKSMAKKLNLDMAQFEKDWKGTKFDALIAEDMKFARNNGARGTPSFFINGVYVRGAQPFPAFKEVIDKLLEQQK
jgi:protein-disulfide isomerase